MHICPKCKQSIPDDRFCQYCGALQEIPSNPSDARWNAAPQPAAPDRQPANVFQRQGGAPDGSFYSYNENEVAQDIAEKIRQLDPRGDPRQGYPPQGNGSFSVSTQNNGVSPARYGPSEASAVSDILFSRPTAKKPPQEAPTGGEGANAPAGPLPGRGYTPFATGKKPPSAEEPGSGKDLQTSGSSSSPSLPSPMPGRGYTPHAGKTAGVKPVAERLLTVSPLFKEPLPEESASETPVKKKTATASAIEKAETERPAAEKPKAETPAGEKPAEETPAAEKTETERPAAAVPCNEPAGPKRGVTPDDTSAAGTQDDEKAGRFPYEPDCFAEIIRTRSERPVQPVSLPFDIDAEPLVTPPAVMIPSLFAESDPSCTEDIPAATPEESRSVEPVHRSITGSDASTSPAPEQSEQPKAETGPAAEAAPEAAEFTPGETDGGFCEYEDYPEELEDVPASEELPTRIFQIPKRRFRRPPRPDDGSTPQEKP